VNLSSVTLKGERQCKDCQPKGWTN